MNSRVVGPVVVRRGAPPADGGRKWRPSRWRFICDAILTLKPGEWFSVEQASGDGRTKQLSTYERAKCAGYVRAWMRAEKIEGVEVYRDTDGHLVVRCEEVKP